MAVTLYTLRSLVFPAFTFQRYADKKTSSRLGGTLHFILFIARIFVHFVHYPKRTPLVVRFYPAYTTWREFNI